MAATAIVGSTGLVGSNILNTLLSQSSVNTVAAFTRRQLSNVADPGNKLRPVTDSNSSQWPADFSTMQPKPSVFLSALGTTRAQAGGFDKQRAVDYDLNLALAKAAKEAGVKVYVLISSAGVSKGSVFPYSRVKAELEDAVAQLGFEHTVIVKPGLIVGTRSDLRLTEYTLRLLANFMGRISAGYLKDFWAQDAQVIGRAAVSAGLKALHSLESPSAPATAPAPGSGSGSGSGSSSEIPKVWYVYQSDILRLGRAEWAKNRDT